MLQYTVQPGDTLSGIAHKHQVTVEAIQSENPRITDINRIEAGWQLRIPANDRDSGGDLPPPRAASNNETFEPECKVCSDEYADIIHVTGATDDQWCLALPESAAEELYREIERVDELMAAFKAAQSKAENDQTEGDADPRKAWLQQAAEEGVIDPEPEQPEEPVKRASRTASLIAQLNEQIAWYEAFDPGYFWSFAGGDDAKREAILQAAKEKRLQLLRSERDALQAQLAPAKPADKGVIGGSIKAKDFLNNSNRVEVGTLGQRRKTEVGIVEIMVFSRPGRWYYVRKRFYTGFVRRYASIRSIKKTRSISQALSNPSATAKELIGKIRDDIAADAAKSPIGRIEVKFAQEQSSKHLLGEEHSSFKWTLDDANPADRRFQASAEAHLMRFAMQASAGINSFDLSKGEVDIGAKAQASMALAEAEVKLSQVFVPNEAGWDCRFTYRNRDGKLSDLAFGAFRLSGEITLNCFAGSRASGEANVRLSTGAASFLLSDRKKVAATGVGLSLSGNAFAGAEAGGSVSGSVAWLHPDEQFRKNANWKDLVKIEAGGTVAAGVGAGLDFELTVSSDGVFFVGSGRLVFGPGASGSFATVIDAEAAWTLCQTVYDVLDETDYSYLSNVSKELFTQWYRSLYMGLTRTVSDLPEMLAAPREAFKAAWKTRQSKKREAAILAQQILQAGRRAQGLGGLARMEYEGIPFAKLPPETLGMICHTLVASFVDSFEEDQETALLLVLSTIGSWRKFFEVLEHMSDDGEKVNPVVSLEMIVALLDDSLGSDQLSEFYHWVLNDLGTINRDQLTLAWTKAPVATKKKRIIAKLEHLDEARSARNLV
ncbi:hypothetical protein BTO32_17435 [Marinobacter lutaoensis]|uniref:LysM domain-containing protein n=1 Tax=Marinobacter lutaoensis TaxID=135739 RepID=A0A1V2DN84_9GAMM|nr:LysM domain-containing protein [Marinobacter lutaoensis]ONF42114.1 hypothetical protein BTO32_17435 [Marinobacter lutaoensis]